MTAGTIWVHYLLFSVHGLCYHTIFVTAGYLMLALFVPGGLHCCPLRHVDYCITELEPFACGISVNIMQVLSFAGLEGWVPHVVEMKHLMLALEYLCWQKSSVHHTWEVLASVEHHQVAPLLQQLHHQHLAKPSVLLLRKLFVLLQSFSSENM